MADETTRPENDNKAVSDTADQDTKAKPVSDPGAEVARAVEQLSDIKSIDELKQLDEDLLSDIKPILPSESELMGGRITASATSPLRHGLLHSLFVLTTLALETAIIVCVALGWLPLIFGVGCHIVVTAMTIGIAYRVRQRKRVSRFFALLAISTAFCGPFGPLGTGFALILHYYFRRNATPFEEWYMSLFPDEVDQPVRQLYEMLTRGLSEAAASKSLSSFTDVLTYGTIDQKQAVITLLSREFRPEFAPALLTALADDNPAVRVQAATAAANIENNFLNKLMELEAGAKAAPNDISAQSALAQFFDDYAFSGILDDDRQAENRRRAEEAYQTVLKLDPENPDTILRIGRLLIRSGRVDEAIEWFEWGFPKGAINPQSISWYLEALYRKGDYGRLRSASRVFGEELANSPEVGERMRDIVKLWSEPEEQDGRAA